MSRLQEFVNKLVQVIVKYHEIQTTRISALESYSNKLTPELHEFLEQLIKEATKSYPTRGPLLDYFLAVIDKVKPLIDMQSPLSGNEEALVSETLFALLTNVQRLLGTSQNNTVNVRFDDSISPMKGLYRGAIAAYAFCNTGQIIMKELFTPLNFSIKDNNFKEAISSMIIEHQRPRQLFKEQIEKLTLIIDELKNECGLSKHELQLEKEKTKSLQEENEQLKLNIAAMKDRFESEQKKTAELSEEIHHLLEEKSNLSSNSPPIKGPINMRYRHFLFGLNQAASPGRDAIHTASLDMDS